MRREGDDPLQIQVVEKQTAPFVDTVDTEVEKNLANPLSVDLR